jgi:hypothetical protein
MERQERRTAVTLNDLERIGTNSGKLSLYIHVHSFFEFGEMAK